MRTWYRLHMEKTMALREARDNLGLRVDAAHFAGEHTVITRNGIPRAVLISYDSYQRAPENVGNAGAELGQTTARSGAGQSPAGHPASGSDQREQVDSTRRSS